MISPFIECFMLEVCVLFSGGGLSSPFIEREVFLIWTYLTYQKKKYLECSSFFTWTAALEGILTSYNLRKEIPVVVEWCFMCKKDGEFVHHLLLHCDIARVMVSSVMFIWGAVGYV